MSSFVDLPKDPIGKSEIALPYMMFTGGKKSFFFVITDLALAQCSIFIQLFFEWYESHSSPSFFFIFVLV